MGGWSSVTPEQLIELGLAQKLVRTAQDVKMASKPRKPRIDLADTLLGQLMAVQVPLPIREYRPYPDRRFRIDLTWLDRKLFAEIDGGEWTHGRHSRGAGMQTDCEKWNRLTLDGWRGLRFTGRQVKDGYALTMCEKALCL